MKKLLLCGLLALAHGLPAHAQNTLTKTKTTANEGPMTAALAPSSAAGFAAGITAAELRGYLTELASDAFEGRETGRPGQQKAADYLTRQLAAMGLRGPVSGGESPFQQLYGVVKTTPTGPGMLLVGGLTFVGQRDFFRFGSSTFGTGSVPADPVFRGYGIETNRYNDYTGLPDVRGRDVIVLIGEPTSGSGRRLFADQKLSAAEQAAEDWRAFFRKAVVARAKGARSLTVLSLFTTGSFRDLGREVGPALAEPTVGLAAPVPQPNEAALLEQGPPSGISLLLTSAPMSLALLGGIKIGVLQRYQTECYRLGQPAPVAFQPAPFSVQFPEQRQELASSNVLGFLEGTDKKDEVLVVSAHYDHLGVVHDTIYNGADDDGSGTSAVLALAHAFAAARAAGQGPRRSILFLLNSGEEEGLLGSEYYTGHPVFPLAQTVADLNIDMVGRTDKAHQGKPSYVYIIGSDRLSRELHGLSEATNAQTTRLRLDYTYNAPNEPEQLYYRSDHYNFARHRIPVIFYTSGLHADYHKATDDVDKIDFPILAERAQLVFYTAWELANREQRIVVDTNKP